MNTTLGRIAAAAPIAVVIFGFGASTAQAMPINPNFPGDTHQVPGDIIVVDPGPVDPGPHVPPVVLDPGTGADPGTDPGTNPSDDTSDDSDHKKHKDSDHKKHKDESNIVVLGDNNANVRRTAATGNNSDNGSSDTPAVDPTDVEQASDVIAPVNDGTTSGVQIPTPVLFGLGAALAGLAAWVGIRRQRMLA